MKLLHITVMKLWTGSVLVIDNSPCFIEYICIYANEA